MYYGIGGLFKDQDTIYLYLDKYNTRWKEIHLPSYSGPASYDGAPDYVYGNTPMQIFSFENERQWHFGWTGLDWWSWGDGKYGTDVSVLFNRNVVDRVKALTDPVPGIKLETEPTTNNPIPYLVVDPSGNIYYAFSLYLDKELNSEYANTKQYNVDTTGDFRRLFAVLLVNTHDGTIQGYRYGDWNENYITQYYGSFYPAWNKEIPDWARQQIRYPKDLMYDMVDLDNTYHIDASDWQDWYSSLNFYDFPTDKTGKYFSTSFDDIRYVPIYYQGTLQYAGVRLVELYQQQSGQWIPRKVVGMYIFLGDGEQFFVPMLSQKVQALQLILDNVNTNRDLQFILTTTQQKGEAWQQGNVLLYIIGGKPIFFIPYYTISQTVTKVTMIVAVDGINANIGYYQLSSSPTPEEVQLAVVRAYTSITKGLLSGEEQRINTVKQLFAKSGYKVVTPEIVNPMIGEVYSNITFRVTQESGNVNATINSFIKDVLVPNKINTVYMWTTTVGPTKILHVGALLPNFVMVIVEISVT